MMIGLAIAAHTYIEGYIPLMVIELAIAAHIHIEVLFATRWAFIFASEEN